MLKYNGMRRSKMGTMWVNIKDCFIIKISSKDINCLNKNDNSEAWL